MLAVYRNEAAFEILFSDQSRKLDCEHIDFLLAPATLDAWAPLSLRERCIKFTEHFPDKKLSYSRLRKIYLAHRVKQRILHKTLTLSAKQQQSRSEQRLNIFPRLLELQSRQFGTFLWCDEAVFTKKAGEAKIWARPGTLPPTIPIQRINFGCVAVVSGIDSEGKVRATVMRKQVIEKTAFVAFLAEAKRNCGLPLHVLVDQHPLHKTIEVSEFCRREGIKLYLNAPYSSEFNAVERLWALSKRLFTRKLVQLNVNRVLNSKAQELVAESINQVNPAALKNHVEACLHRLGLGERVIAFSAHRSQGWYKFVRETFAAEPI